jgi:hypothetical protein
MDSQAFNTITILANRSFIHLIAPKNWPISTPVRPIMDIMDRKQDLFAYITTEHYTPKEFYGVIIDTDTSKKSTAGYRQYFIYKTTAISNMDINIMQAGAVNVQFGISSTILIRLVTVKTLISLVDFYIIKADTPFLLCLVDMDRLQVYYNNITDTLTGPVTALGSKHITLLII